MVILMDAKNTLLNSDLFMIKTQQSKPEREYIVALVKKSAK